MRRTRQGCKQNFLRGISPREQRQPAQAAAGFRPRTCSQEGPAVPIGPRLIKRSAGGADEMNGGIAVFWLALAGVVLLALAALGELVAAGWPRQQSTG